MDKYILSIDASTVSTGWSIMTLDGKLIKYGCIKPNKDDDVLDRIRVIIANISQIIADEKPYLIIQEDVPPSIKNAMTVKTLSTLKGGLLALAHINNIPVRYILPNVWQSALKILKANGSTKEQSVNFVNTHYNTGFKFISEASKKNEDDITDSICIAHYYINKRRNNL